MGVVTLDNNNIFPNIKQPNKQELMEMKTLMLNISQERNWPAENLINNYDDNSINWIALSNTGKIIGATKVLIGSSSKFCINNNDGWPNLVIQNNSAEVALTVVDKKERGNKIVLFALCCNMFKYFTQENINYVYAILDKTIFNLYKRIGFQFKIIDKKDGGGEKIYWGEKCFPVVMNIEKTISFAKQNKPQLWNTFKKYFSSGKFNQN